MDTIKTTVTGFLAASVVPSLFFALFTPLSDSLDFVSFAGTFLVTYQFSVLALAVLGIPTYLLFRRFNLTSLWLAIAAGVVGGVLVAILIRLPDWPDSRGLLTFGVLGAATTFTFWMVWKLSGAQKRV